jgi:hypothetical protein
LAVARETHIGRFSTEAKSPFDDDDDVYLDKLQTRGVEKSILYM